MILVDSSVWIAQIRGLRTEATAALVALADRETLLVGDIVLLEVLQGARDEDHAEWIERALRRYLMVSLLTPELAASAARNYRKLRTLGVTIRKTPDLIIGTFCIERGHRLLHADRDFEPMQRHLGLIAV
jgi:predicted nucleic acid-binding protein